MDKKLLLVQHTEILPEQRASAEDAGFETLCLAGDNDSGTLVKTALDNGVVGIWAGSAQVAGAVATAQQQLGLPSLNWHGDVEPLLALQECGIPVVPAYRVETEDEANAAAASIEGDVVVSSTAETANILVGRLSFVADLPLLLAQARRHSQDAFAIVRGNYSGSTFQLVALMHHREFKVLGIVQVDCMDRPYAVPFRFVLGSGCAGIVDAALYRKMVTYARQAAKVLPPGWGMPVFEFSVQDNDVILIHVGASPTLDGSLAQVFKAGMGLDLQKASMCCAGGTIHHKPASRSMAAALAWMQPRSGMVESIEGEEEALALPGILAVQCHSRPGDAHRHAIDLSSRDKTGYILSNGTSSTQAEARIDSALQTVKIVTSLLRLD